MSMRVEKFNNRQQVPTSFGDDFKDNVLKFLIDNETGYEIRLTFDSTDVGRLGLYSKTGNELSHVTLEGIQSKGLKSASLEYNNKRLCLELFDGSKVYCDITELIDKKLDKITTGGSNRVYAVDTEGRQTYYKVSVAPATNSVALRNSYGRVRTATPVEDDSAANKKYVDDKFVIRKPSRSDYDQAYVKPAITEQTPTIMVNIWGGEDSSDPVGDTLVKRDSEGRIQGTVFSKSVHGTMTSYPNIEFPDYSTIKIQGSSEQSAERITLNSDGVTIFPGSSSNESNETEGVIKLDGKTIINKTTFTDNNEVVNKAYIDTKDTELSTRIDNLSAVGRFLSSWNCTTGKPADYPSVPVGAEYPYTYNFKTGDYYIIGTAPAEGTKYRPDGGSISKETAESEWTVGTRTETNTVAVGDFYFYTTNGWIWLSNEQKTTTFSAIAGDAKDNTSLADYLNNTATLTVETSNTYIASATVSNGVLTLTTGAVVTGTNINNLEVVKYKQGPTVTRIRQN